jgi:glucosamine--fructose-6-phosphate aminotransferase (isomerizing)
MCGFFSIIYDGDREELGRVLVNAGRRLSYRGYDSVGAFVQDSKNKWELRKDVGKIEGVASKLHLENLTGKIGIIQLRWATFGAPSRENAQPHSDCKEQIFGAHNGNVVNSPVLREELLKEGHRIKGENDGEIVVHVVEKWFSRTGDMVRAIMEAAKDLRGDYAYTITRLGEERVFAVKKGASLFLGVGDRFICVSSDQVSILEHTKRIIPLEDNEFVEFGHDYYIIRDLETGERIEREPVISNISPETATKSGFPHFMIKEIHEQPVKSRELINLMPELKVFEEAARFILSSKRTYVVGSGTSYHAALVGAYFASHIAGEEFIVSIASEFPERHSMNLNGNELLIAVSQSGETKDVIHCVDIFGKITEENKKIIGVINVLGSTLALRSGILLPIATDLEISVPATKTFINQVLIFLYLALKIAEIKGLKLPFDFEYLVDIPDWLEESIETSEKVIPDLIDRIGYTRSLHILGYGVTLPIALEGSLKLKEVVYINSEGMHSGEFKHGPLAVVDPGYPVIFVSSSKDRDMVLSHINEVRTRRGFVVTIAQQDDELQKSSDFYIPLPETHYLITPITSVIPLQMLAYQWSVIRGIDPDFPKNISKTLTVF